MLVDAGKNDIVRLVLGGLKLHNETGPALYAPQCERVALILQQGTENTLSAVYANTDDPNEPDATVFVQDNLYISGSGTLDVFGNFDHGIRCQDNLVILAGNVKVDAMGDALRGRDGVAIQAGSFDLMAGGDGIQASGSVMMNSTAVAA